MWKNKRRTSAPRNNRPYKRPRKATYMNMRPYYTNTNTRRAQAYSVNQKVLTKYHDIEYLTTANQMPIMHNLCSGLTMGVAQNEYIGCSIQPICCTIRILPYLAAASAYLRILIFQSMSPTTPLAADILQHDVGLQVGAPIRHAIKDDILVLRDIFISGNTGYNLSGQSALDPNITDKYGKIYIKGKKMTIMSNIDSGVIVNGCLYFYCCSDLNGAWPIRIVSRLEYRDCLTN